VRVQAERARQYQIDQARAVLEHHKAQAAKGDPAAIASVKQTQALIDQLESDEHPVPAVEDEEDEVALFDQDFSAFSLAGNGSVGNELLSMATSAQEQQPTVHQSSKPQNWFDQVGTYLIDDGDDEMDVAKDKLDASPGAFAMQVESPVTPSTSSSAQPSETAVTDLSTKPSTKYHVQEVLTGGEHEFETVMHYPWEIDIVWSDAKPAAPRPRQPVGSDDEEDETSLADTNSSDESAVRLNSFVSLLCLTNTSPPSPPRLAEFRVEFD